MNLTIGSNFAIGAWYGCKFRVPGFQFYGEVEYRFGSVGSGPNSDWRGLARGYRFGLGIRDCVQLGQICDQIRIYASLGHHIYRVSRAKPLTLRIQKNIRQNTHQNRC